MRYYTILFLFLFLQKGICQKVQKTDSKNEIKHLTIFSTKNKNTNLFFPDVIKSGIVGNSNFTFGYKKEGDGSKIGILKSTSGEESNLLVVTSNGNIYSFLIKHVPNIERLNYFIKDSMAIGNENGAIIYDNPPEIETPIPPINKREIKENVVDNGSIAAAVKLNDYQTVIDSSSNKNYENNCKIELQKKKYYSNIIGVKDRILIKLKCLTYLDNDLYFTLIIENNSTLDYDINYLNYYTVSKNKKRNTVTQKIPYESKYVYNMPTRILSKEKKEVVFVFEKFTINQNKSLLIEMTEQNGERTVELELSNNLINNPK